MKTLRAAVLALVMGVPLMFPATALAEASWLKCHVDEVQTLANRVHVRCTSLYFAVPTSSSAEATRLVTLGTAALLGAGGGNLWVLSDAMSHDAESFGCQFSNCRRPIEVKLLK